MKAIHPGPKVEGFHCHSRFHVPNRKVDWGARIRLDNCVNSTPQVPGRNPFAGGEGVLTLLASFVLPFHISSDLDLALIS